MRKGCEQPLGCNALARNLSRSADTHWPLPATRVPLAGLREMGLLFCATFGCLRSNPKSAHNIPPHARHQSHTRGPEFADPLQGEEGIASWYGLPLTGGGRKRRDLQHVRNDRGASHPALGPR